MKFELAPFVHILPTQSVRYPQRGAPRPVYMPAQVNAMLCNLSMSSIVRPAEYVPRRSCEFFLEFVQVLDNCVWRVWKNIC